MADPTLEQLIEQTKRLIAQTQEFIDKLRTSQEYHEKSLKNLRESLAQMEADLAKRNSN